MFLGTAKLLPWLKKHSGKTGLLQLKVFKEVNAKKPNCVLNN